MQQRTQMWQQETQTLQQENRRENIDMIGETLAFRFDVQPMRYEQRLAQLSLPALK